MTCGVYLLDFGSRNKYVGCSGSIETRVKQHLYRLSKQAHTNHLVQQAFNTYGTPSITILEECSQEEMYTKEISYIEELNTYYKGLNRSKGGRSGYVLTEEEKEVYVNVLLELAYTDKTSVEIGSLLNIGEGVVRRIANFTSHTYLKESHPIEYALMSSKLFNRPKSDFKTAEARGIVYPNLVSPEGVVYTITSVKGFSKEHNLGYSSLHKLLTSKISVFKGWKRVD